jgi:hypothetical protein
LNLSFLVFPTPHSVPLTTQIQQTSFENEENEKGTPLNTQRFHSINKQVNKGKITFKYTQTDDYLNPQK